MPEVAPSDAVCLAAQADADGSVTRMHLNGDGNPGSSTPRSGNSGRVSAQGEATRRVDREEEGWADTKVACSYGEAVIPAVIPVAGDVEDCG